MLVPTTIVLVTLLSQTSVVTQPITEIVGTVDQIDSSGRVVTIRSAEGQLTPIYVGPDLPAFDQLQRGDRVAIGFYDSYIVEATPGARMTAVQDTTAEAQKKLDRPDVAILQQLRIVVTIDEIDRRNNTVTYHDVTGRRVMRGVQNPKLLEALKPGDVVTLTSTRARAARIEKQR